jgi:hypothetical protein
VGHIEFSLFDISIIERRNTLIIIDISSYYAEFYGGYVGSFVSMAVRWLKAKVGFLQCRLTLYGKLDLLYYLDLTHRLFHKTVTCNVLFGKQVNQSIPSYMSVL